LKPENLSLFLYFKIIYFEKNNTYFVFNGVLLLGSASCVGYSSCSCDPSNVCTQRELSTDICITRWQYLSLQTWRKPTVRLTYTNWTCPGFYSKI